MTELLPAPAVVHVVCGPTGAGKSGLAIALAAKHGLTIVSADSRQLYRGFDIGTAKPSKVDLAAVPHRGIDVAEPTERWSAARWAGDATQWVEEIGAVNVLIVGGTGLYLRALSAPLFDEPVLGAGRARRSRQSWKVGRCRNSAVGSRDSIRHARISGGPSCCARSRLRCSLAID